MDNKDSRRDLIHSFDHMHGHLKNYDYKMEMMFVGWHAFNNILA